MWTRRAVSIAGACGSLDKQEKQTVQTISWHVGGAKTSVPSLDGMETQAIQLGGAPFLRRVECSSR